MKKVNIIRSIFVAELVLLVPFVAMFYTEEVDWKLPDFIVVGILLAGVGFAYQLIVTGLKDNTNQVALGIVIGVAMILVWLELAVGIIGTPFAGS